MSPDARRAQLLKVALGEFAARGYHATSINHIIEKADVARGTFYQYFKSKREIFDSLLDQLFAEVNAAVAPIAIAAPEAIARAIRANIEALCRTLQENLPMGRVLLEQAVGVDDAGRSSSASSTSACSSGSSGRSPSASSSASCAPAIPP